MSQRASPAMIGAFVLGALVLLLAGIFLLGSGELFRKKYRFVSYFEESVNGLREGSAVKFKGVEIGSVDQIRLPLGPDNPPVLVFFSLDAEELGETADRDLTQADLDRAIEAGLRAQLGQESFVTGQLHLAVVFAPESEAKLHDPIPGYPELPTIQTTFAEFTARLGRMVDGLERIDLVAFMEDLHATTRAAGDLMRSETLASSITSLDRTLADLSATTAIVREKIGPLADSLLATSDSARSLSGELQSGAGEAREILVEVRQLAGSLDRSVRELTASLEATLQAARDVVGPNAPPVTRLQEALGELSATARAARAVLEILEREPAALVRGLGERE